MRHFVLQPLKLWIHTHTSLSHKQCIICNTVTEMHVYPLEHLDFHPNFLQNVLSAVEQCLDILSAASPAFTVVAHFLPWQAAAHQQQHQERFQQRRWRQQRFHSLCGCRNSALYALQQLLAASHKPTLHSQADKQQSARQDS